MSASISLQILESLTAGRIASVILVFLVASFIVDFTWKPSYPASIPRVGNGEGVLATLRNWVGYITQYNGWVEDGYGKYSKKDQFFVVPSAASRPSEIVVPKSQTMWLLEFPDRVVSSAEAQDDVLNSYYNFLGMMDNAFAISTVHKHLARHLPQLIPGVQEEVANAIDKTFGEDTENWKSLNLWEAWLGLIPQITNRILVGKEICRDPEFLRCQVGFADDVVRNGFFLSMVPKILHPVVGRLAALPNWLHWRKSKKIAGPMIEKRLEDLAKKASGDPEYQDWEPAQDMVTWLILQAQIDGKAPPSVDSVSKWLLPVEFAAIHTTVLTGHSLLLDLLCADPSRRYLDEIREETANVLAEENGSWTKQGLSRLYKTDSAIKESQRYSHFASSLVHRKVVAKDGITHKGEGWHAPQGAMLMLNLGGLHHDPDIYDNPEDFDAFRFARAREEYEARPQDQKDPDEGLRIKKLGMVTTSDHHLAFGHGRHACPGRFFVAHELKMILAYLFANYDIKQITDRPKPLWIGNNIIPPLSVKIEVRRRKATK